MPVASFCLSSPVPHLLNTNFPPSAEEERVIRAALRQWRAELFTEYFPNPSAQKQAAYFSLLEEHTQILAPIRFLPQEVLAKILCYALRDSVLVGTPLGVQPIVPLMRVCRRWENLILATPACWSSVTAVIQNLDSVDHMHEWLARSGSHALDVAVSFRTRLKKIHDDTRLESGVQEFFEAYRPRFRSIELDLKKIYDSVYISELLREFSMLEFLAITNLDRTTSQREVILDSLPRLRRFSYSGLHYMGYVQLPWRQLTHLHSRTPATPLGYLRILNHCPLLVDCTLMLGLNHADEQEYVYTALGGSLKDPASQVHLPHLCNLKLTDLAALPYQDGNLLDFLDGIDAPSLRSVDLHAPVHRDPNTHCIDSIFAQQRRLESISLRFDSCALDRNCKIGPRLIHGLALCSSTLKDLTLKFHSGSIHQLLVALTPSGNTPYLCPHLRTLDIRGQTSWRNAAFLEMVASRCPHLVNDGMAVQPGSLRRVVTMLDPSPWYRQDIWGLWQLVSRGLDAVNYDIDGKPFPLEALWDYVTQDESHRPRPEDEEYWRIANWRDEIARVAWE